jgi:hypothetical protein
MLEESLINKNHLMLTSIPFAATATATATTTTTPSSSSSTATTTKTISATTRG